MSLVKIDKSIAFKGLSTAETLAKYDSELMNFFDRKAKEKNYDNRITCSLRAGYPGPFQAEGLAFAQWMDQCNAYCYEVIQDIQEGTRVIPTFEELSSEFPELVW